MTDYKECEGCGKLMTLKTAYEINWGRTSEVDNSDNESIWYSGSVDGKLYCLECYTPILAMLKQPLNDTKGMRPVWIDPKLLGSEEVDTVPYTFTQGTIQRGKLDPELIDWIKKPLKVPPAPPPKPPVGLSARRVRSWWKRLFNIKIKFEGFK